jgi:hypothetical protein
MEGIAVKFLILSRALVDQFFCILLRYLKISHQIGNAPGVAFRDENVHRAAEILQQHLASMADDYFFS